MTRLHKTGTIEVSLKTLICEIFTISPIRVSISCISIYLTKSFITFSGSSFISKIYQMQVFGQNNLHFAAIGLLDMYNSGGAIETILYDAEKSAINVRTRGCGRFGAYSSCKPKCCKVDTEAAEFKYNSADNLVILQLAEGSGSCREIEFVY